MKPIHTHYDNFKVTRDAPDIVIRAAYRSLTQKHHPDKNPGDQRAARIMAILNQSYEVLCDPIRRREHDEWIARTEAPPMAAPKVYKQAPRAASTRSRDNPLHTRRAPDHSRLRPQSILATIAARAGWVGLRVGIAVGLLLIVGITLDHLPSRAPAQPKSVISPVVEEAAAKPTLPFSLEPSCKSVGMANGLPLYRCRHSDGLVTYSRRPSGELVPAVLGGAEAEKKRIRNDEVASYTRPLVAPNSSPWPKSSGYIKGYPVAKSDGLSTVTVDNGQNSADVFVKLVSLDGSGPFPTRHIFIRAFEKFTARHVDAGRYEIHYLDLDNGRPFGSEGFDVEQIRKNSAIQYSAITLTLYLVPHGNFNMHPLPFSNF